MKKSTTLLLILSASLLTGMLATDVMLKRAYAEINVHDPFKNYEDYPVDRFRALRLRGGNAYAIHLRYADTFHIRVMKSRRGFLKAHSSGDTLSVDFSVPKSTQQRAVDELPAGLIIYVPDLRYLQCNGTSVLATRLAADSLVIRQSGSAFTVADSSVINSLQIHGCENSWIDFRKNNTVKALIASAGDNAGINMKGIRFNSFHPLLTGNGKIVFYDSSMRDLTR